MKQLKPLKFLKKLGSQLSSRRERFGVNLVSDKNNRGLALSSMQELQTASKFRSNSLELVQRGFNLEGKCHISDATSNLLVAMINEHVIGSSYINLASLNEHDRKTEYVQVSIDLNAQLLFENSKEDVQFFQYNSKKNLVLAVSAASLLKNITPTPQQLAHSIPSYGFFGGGKREPLKLTVAEKLSAVKLEIASDGAAILNLRKLKINGEDGNTVDLSNIVVDASSTYNGTDPGNNLLLGKGFHSASESRPWLIVRFKEPTFVSSLEITNRGDKWGLRSQKLEVSITDEHKVSTVLYAPYSSYGIESFCAQTAQLFGARCLELVVNDGSQEEILEIIYNELKCISENELHARHALAFLSMWATNKSDEPKEIEIKILAFYIHHILKRSLNLSLLPFSKILTRAASVQLLEDEVNLLRNINSLEAIKFTKHGVASAGMLVTNASKALHAIGEIIRFLSEHGLNPCLAYGTLLGGVREQGFIPHDDDIDLLVEYPESVTSLEEAFNFRNQLLKLLSTNEYSTYAEATAVLHLVHKGTGIMVDIFPYWKVDGNVHLYMEKMKLKAIDGAILDGRAQASLHEHSFPAPAKPEQFLCERYGENWEVSDKFHEWPWHINNG